VCGGLRGDVAWSDIFASGDLFESLLARIVRQLRVEALTRPATAGRFRATMPTSFLRRLNGRETQETEPGVYRGAKSEGQLAQSS